jgi:hypothetical protein
MNTDAHIKQEYQGQTEKVQITNICLLAEPLTIISNHTTTSPAAQALMLSQVCITKK